MKEMKNLSNRAMICGFYGIDSYDIIHYLSRIFKNLNKKILLVDKSCNKALFESISKPENLQGNSIVSYRDIDYMNEYDDNQASNYDYIFIDFGLNDKDKTITCDKLFLLTDLQVHNVNYIKRIYRVSDIKSKVIIIRNAIKCKIKPEFILSQMGRTIHNSSYVIYEDFLDQESKIKCQYNDKIIFNRLSPMFKSSLKKIVIDEFKYNKKDIKKAYRLAARGA